MTKIYALGTMQIDLDGNSAKIKAQRLWHFFANFEDAEKSVLENHENIFEYYYNVALVEEHPVYDPKDNCSEYIYNYPVKQWWYQCTYPTVRTIEDNLIEGNFAPIEPIITKIEVPAQFKNICNFWAG